MPAGSTQFGQRRVLCAWTDDSREQCATFGAQREPKNFPRDALVHSAF